MRSWSMPKKESSEQPFGSTTVEWKWVKIVRPPEASTQRRRRRHFQALSRWDPRSPLTLKVTRRGGPEMWYEIHARGAIMRCPGWHTIHDVMSRIYGEQ